MKRGGCQIDLPPRKKTTLKSPAFIRVKVYDKKIKTNSADFLLISFIVNLEEVLLSIKELNWMTGLLSV